MKAVDSFATCHISCRSEGNVRSVGRLQIKPYFGYFSGCWITFDVRKSLDSAGNHKIKVKIDGCKCPSSIYLRTHQPLLDLSKSATKLKLKDLCFQYVHSTKAPNFNFTRNPSSLVFLCERKVLLSLNEINPAILPQVSFSHLNPNVQDIIVKVWSGSSNYPTRIERMKVKQGISISELKWILCYKLSIGIEPSKLDIHEYRTVEKLSDDAYLASDQALFHCVVVPSIQRDSIIVCLVDQDIEEIKMDPHDMTLNQFQAKIKEKFALHPSSFVFIPQAFKNEKRCNEVTMSAVLEKSTLPLIDSKRRNLPIVGSIPLTLLKYEQLDMYKLELCKLNLLSSNLVYVYEVTGPTIPILLRTSTSCGKGEYALISDRPHAVSINLNWPVRTLLKYLEEISHFPCEDISYGGSLLPHDSLLSGFFSGCSWRVQCKSGQSTFIEEVPRVVNT